MTTRAAQYYDALTGAWSGHYHLQVRDRKALSTLPARVRLTGFMAGVDGNMTMSTTLQRIGNGVYSHTTRMSRFGIPLLTSDEKITISGDGTEFVISGQQRMPFWREPFEGTGSIDEDALGADYPISWLRQPLRQRTRVQPEGLLLTQETSWSFASVLLRRLP